MSENIGETRKLEWKEILNLKKQTQDYIVQLQ